MIKFHSRFLHQCLTCDQMLRTHGDVIDHNRNSHVVPDDSHHREIESALNRRLVTFQRAFPVNVIKTYQDAFVVSKSKLVGLIQCQQQINKNIRVALVVLGKYKT